MFAGGVDDGQIMVKDEESMLLLATPPTFQRKRLNGTATFCVDPLRNLKAPVFSLPGAKGPVQANMVVSLSNYSLGSLPKATRQILHDLFPSDLQPVGLPFSLDEENVR
ncbi:hypothetical protein HYDPIDRAFT_35120 [Hydnomerulius pinastri MD-312]|uniref:Uncharacterized protein n=1 Tax=Hydnomerulius pinastri MD-312 TaxID=994086 RepID=A0A0C2PWI6_9AGAM|nr:hypothetical protein HYDPIDRAFT_35120 [Hydnomerulius pinastri MD-312]